MWVAFVARGKLNKISVEGGTAITLCNVSNPRGGSWGEDGNIIAALSINVGLSRVPTAGGSPTSVTELDRERGEISHRWPQILPGGKAVLFTTRAALGGYDEAEIEVMSLGDHHRKTLVRGGTFGRYLPSGHLVYLNHGTLFAVPFDLNRLEVRGTPTPVLDQVSYSIATGSAQLDFSQTGTLVYRSGGASGQTIVQWLDAAGKAQALLAKPDAYVRPRLSPDGTRLAVSTRDIWVYDWQRDTMTRLTFGAGGSINPLWSPDGRYVLFEAAGGMFWTRSDGSGKPQPLIQSKNLQYPWSFTPDGKRLAFAELNPQMGFDLWTVPLENDTAGLRAGKPEPFLQTAFNEWDPSYSPDGRWLAYDSDESGSYQVYVRAFPDKGGKWQISSSGGVYPEWSRNGHELFFRTEDSQVMVASYTLKGDSFVADKPRVWSEKRIANVGLFASYDLATDGKRIVAVMPEEPPQGQQQSHVVFLENFFDELRRRTATQAK
jgi:serine/threonine-protein kinase